MSDNILDMMVEIELSEPDDFLKIKETLTRIGVSSELDGNKRLFPSVVLLHKKGKYYLSHFKTMFLLDGKQSNISSIDIKRLYTIAKLVSSWKLCKIADESKMAEIESSFNPKLVRIVPFFEKDDWHIVHKYTAGAKKRRNNPVL